MAEELEELVKRNKFSLFHHKINPASECAN
jgi:hypothetical protein